MADYCDKSYIRMEREKIGDNSFIAHLEGDKVGRLFVTRSSYGPVKVRAPARTIRHHNSKSDRLFLNLKLSGKAIVDISGNNFVQDAGDFVIFDTGSPYEVFHPEDVDQLSIEVPRERLERMLGVACLYTGFTLQGNLPTAAVLRCLLMNLVRVCGQLAPDAAERMSSVVVDLVIACIAERMALKTPRSLRGMVVVQRAKAYIEANLRDPELNSSKVAAATNVSLRFLQERFRENDRHVADWIWQRRLETAAAMLCDPVLMHSALDAVAYSCGFSSQSHFSRRFKDRYEMSPSMYRRSALAAAAELRNTNSAI